MGGGPRVVVSTTAFHARVRGSVPGLGGLKETKLFLPHPRVKVSIVGSLRDREVACSASDRQGSNFEFCVWRTVSSQSSHHPQEVLMAQFSLYVHKGGLKPDSFHFILFRLLRVQNRAACLVTQSKTQDHITPVLRDLHWLPVSSRIDFKLCLYIYKALKKTAPIYISDELSLYEHKRPLRSSYAGPLYTVSVGRKDVSDFDFAIKGPRLWNSLPSRFNFGTVFIFDLHQ